LISQQIAINPLILFQYDGNGTKTEATNHDYFDLVTSSPNPEQNAIDFRTAVQMSIELTGNGYIEIQRDGGARVVALWHRSSERTEPIRLSNGTLAYRTTDGINQEVRHIKLEDMIHLKGTCLHAAMGLNPLEFFRGPIGSKLAMDKYGARFFANNATPSGILSVKQKVKPEDKPKMRADWESQMLGGNQHRVNILDQEATFTPITIHQDNAQYLESKIETAKEIAAFFGVQGYAVGLLDKGIKANVEQQAQDLYNYCLRPRMAKWEMAFSTKLFNNKGRSAGRYGAHFNVFKLLHPDDVSIQKSIQSSIQNAVITPNEGRAWLGLNGIGSVGDRHYLQLNMQTLENANAAVPDNGQPDPELAREQEENSLPKRLGQNYRSLFKDGVQRLLKTSNRDYKSVYRCLWPTLDAMAKAASQSIEGEHPECDKAVDDLILKIEHRAKKWTEEDIETICADELKKVATSLIYAVNRDEANAKSKKIIESLSADETEQEIE
jgi:HK97 family phage portal protein